MRREQFRPVVLLVALAASALLGVSLAAAPDKLPLDRWTYIQVDDSRGKWGDFDPPEWLRYYGLSAFDVNGDGYLDIIAGRYFYRNPGGDMTAHWERIDLGRNVNTMLFVDVDGDKFADCIAEALPDVYWLEAEDLQGKSWKAIKIACLPPAQHVNGQGFTLAQIIPGGRPEILLSTGKGIYYIEIPSNPSAGNWPVTLAAEEASEQGLAVADLNGDGRADILVTEESWQTQDRVAPVALV